MSRKKKSDDFDYVPKWGRPSKSRKDKPIYVELDTPELPDLRDRLEKYLRDIGNCPIADFYRWLTVYAIKNRLVPPRREDE